MSDARRTGAVPHARATALFARTIYRELRRADYGKDELTRFVTDLVELIAANMNRVDPELDEYLVGVVDAETGLPNRHVLDEVLSFEVRRAQEKQAPLLLACVELSMPEWVPDDVAHGAYLRTAAILRHRLRPDDTVARLPPNRFVIVLPGATPAIVPALSTRLSQALLTRRREVEDAALPAGAKYVVRTCAWTAELAEPEALLEACLSAEAVTLGAAAGETSTATPTSTATATPTATATATPTATAAGARAGATKKDGVGVVLALGGGAVRAAAHVGVVEVLEQAGVRVRGIAGTSAGALVGAMLLSGQSYDEIVERFASFVGTRCHYQIRRQYAVYRRRTHRERSTEKYFRQSGLAFMSDVDLSAVGDDLFEEFIQHFVGADRDVSTLSKPFAAAATDLVDGRPAYFTRGPLWHALRASCAVPGLFAPQHDGARLLVDGSTVSDVPVGAALVLDAGAPIVGVYLERPAQRVTRFETSAEVVTRTASLVHTELVREQLRHCPVLLSVPVGDVPWLDFRRAADTRRIGALAAREAISDLVDELRARA